jgi:hypothetical protein
VRTIVLLFATSALVGRAASPYLPEPGKLNVNFSYAYDRYGNFKAGSSRSTALPGTLQQHSFFPSLSYGLTRRLALDFDTSYTRSSLPAITLNAVVNTSYGVRVQAYRGERATLSLRAAGVRSELYPIDLGPIATGGVSVNGFHGSAQLGLVLPKRGFVLLDGGYLTYQKPVPGRFLGSAFVGQNRGAWTYFAGYQENRAFSGVDIAGLATARIRFAEYRRAIGTFSLGGGRTTARGVYVGANWSRWIAARNAPESSGVVVTLGFRVPLR